MGPIILFDKSFLQSLSVDESVWFDRFFLAVVCPVFYVETLADLAKATNKRPAELIVRAIAEKFPEMSGSPCGDHQRLAVGDLLGWHIPMDGRVPRTAGRAVKSGTVYDQAPEEAAFHRWQKGEFAEVERLAAARWRQALTELDLDLVAKEFRSFGISGQACKNLGTAKDIAKSIVDSQGRAFQSLRFATLFFGIPEYLHARVIETWKAEGQRSLSVFAPYAAFVLTVEIFFSGRTGSKSDFG